jgi:hypothetical protein
MRIDFPRQHLYIRLTMPDGTFVDHELTEQQENEHRIILTEDLERFLLFGYGRTSTPTGLFKPLI